MQLIFDMNAVVFGGGASRSSEEIIIESNELIKSVLPTKWLNY